ncbi:hypothetical protein I7I53_00477 [Histoplasma capsulatum var. duboisii H88]|uniref:Uncharacterized protein n=1 Tax=Ajellomyces capsulatus (strain H88) TaxID=544711 RepID=A0A8A1LLC9_AJEC8|nr:hypothetical protein I7I53_00477 [Histoplasma capsulatum var. duboisii H88]
MAIWIAIGSGLAVNISNKTQSIYILVNFVVRTRYLGIFSRPPIFKKCPRSYSSLSLWYRFCA